MKKILILFISALLGFSLQAMDVDSRSDQGKLILFKTSDQQVFQLPRSVAQQLGTLAHLLEEAEQDPSYNPQEALPIGSNITLVEFQQMVSFLQLLTECKKEDEQVQKDTLKTMYNSLLLDDDQRFRFTKNVRYLDIPKVLHILPVPVQTNDEKIFWVEPSIVIQSSVLTNNCQDCGDNEPIFLQNIDSKSFKLTLEALKRKSFEGFSPEEKVNLYRSSDYLGIEAIVAQSEGTDSFLRKAFPDSNVSFSPDGKFAGIGSFRDDGKLLSLADYSVLKTFKYAIGFSFSPDGKFVGINYRDGTNGKAELVRLSDYFPIKNFSGHSDFNFSPDGKFVGVNKTSELINLTKLSYIKPFETQGCHFKFSPDGKFVVASYGYGKKNVSKLISLANSSTIKTCTGTRIDNFTFSPNGKFIGVGHNKGRKVMAELIDLTKPKIEKTIISEGYSACTFFFSPDSKFVGISYGDDDNNKVELINLNNYLVQKIFDKATKLSFSPDSKFVSINYNDKAELICLEDDSVLKTFAGYYADFSFSPDSKFVGVSYIGDDKKDKAELIRIADCSVLKAFCCFNATYNKIHPFSFSRDSKVVDICYGYFSEDYKLS